MAIVPACATMTAVRNRGGVRSLVIAATVLMVVAAGCSSSSGPPTVAIKGFAFHPGHLVVHAGQTLTVANQDTVLHGFTANDKTFEIPSITAGSSATVSVPKVGVYPYHCPIHVSMTGVLEVKP